MMRQRQLIIVAVLIFFAIITYTTYKLPKSSYKLTEPPIAPSTTPSLEAGISDAHQHGPDPKPMANASSHPIKQLMTQAQAEFDQLFARQSKTLPAAAKEYRRRYGIPPPPNFDKWYSFATKHNIQLIDEFDTIQETLVPFWGISPKTIRRRAKEALGNDNFLLGVSIRDHKVTLVEGGQEWQRNATESILQKFVEWLPDMDLAFNAHDEPRVMVPFDDMSRLVAKARNEVMPKIAGKKKLKNSFSPRPEGLGEGKFFEETKVSRFNKFPFQATWTTSRMSCPPDSPARSLDDEDPTDARSAYGLSELGFVYNTTAMTDICESPSVKASWGFFSRPNAFSVVHDLFPIFSQSKISSYADILYPSPWYWNDQVAYDEAKDVKWEDKENKLFWRGSTTGGFSRFGGWRKQHRQNFVQKINSREETKTMVNKGSDEKPKWTAASTQRGDHRDLIDVHFSHVGQCDKGDCKAQIEFFEVVDRVEQQDAWSFKYLLDMDGNAFSGRFYAFLKSKSLVFKLALFREWHAEWLKPWVHYIPLSLQGDDWLEAVRYFGAGPGQQNEGERLASASREWAGKAVRKEDMEAWFFRLLLEYGRLIDDDRESIGYDPSM